MGLSRWTKVMEKKQNKTRIIARRISIARAFHITDNRSEALSMQKLKKHGGCFYCRREIAALFLLLCGRCLAFVPGNTPTSTRHRDGRTCSVKSSITPAAKSTVAVAHRCSTRSSRLLSVLLISRSSLQSSTSRIGTKNGEAENNSRNSEDPFRSKRASLAPTIINALHRVLFHGEKAETAASLSSEQRAASDEWKLTEDERETVMNRVCGVADNLTELRFMLAAAVTR